MKILFFVRLFHPHVGGVEKHVEKISEVLVKQGHNIIVITEKNDDSENDYETHKGIRIYRIPIRKNENEKKFYIWAWLWKHQDLMRSADIIHCHDVFFWYFPFRFIYPRKPVYTTFHGYEEYPIRKNAIRIRKLSELLSKGNICVGSFIQKWYKTKPTYVIYGGIETPQKETMFVNKLSAGFIGRLENITGVKEYIKAVNEIKKYESKFNLSIAGSGSLKDVLENQGIHVNRSNNAIKFLSQFHFAFVSGYLSILEAMIVKRLVFAVYDNALKEDYLRMTPYANSIVIVKDANEIAEKVEYFLKNPNEEKKMVEESYAWAKKQNWNNIVNIYLKLWQK